MNLKKTKAFVLSAMLAVGVTGLAPSYSFARDRVENISRDDVPRAVRNTIDNWRGRRDLKTLERVERGKNLYYRAIIDDKGGEDTVLYIREDGKIVRRDEVEDPSDRRDNERREIDRRDVRGDEERDIRLSNVPARAREMIERERGNRELKSVSEVNRDGRVFYRAIIDERNGDRMIRVSEGGKLLGDEEIREVRQASGKYGPVRRGYDDDGDRVAFEHLPGPVKTAIGREAGPDRVTDVYRYQRRGGDIYEADITGGGRSHTLRVNENGRVLSETDDTPDGRRTVRFDDLPGEVKDAIGRDVRRDEISRIVQVTEGGHTYYRAQVQTGRDREPTWVTVDDRGHRVSEFDRRR